MSIPSNLTPEQTAQLASLLRQGNKIGAVKQCRIFTGLGLKEAKDAVEALEAKLRAESPEQFAAPPASSAEPGLRQKPAGCLGGAAALLAVTAGILGWICLVAFASPSAPSPVSPLSLARSGGWLEVKDVEDGRLPFRDGKAHGSWTQELPASSADESGKPAKSSGLHVGTVLNASIEDGVAGGSVFAVGFEGYIDLGSPGGPEKLAPVTKVNEAAFRIANPGPDWTRVEIGEDSSLSVRWICE
ncbi:50S ribosomal protein L12 [Opitutaceae bacterium TAV5]|nr:50S ribosomal protein L12 [Opitutaceae bacterium TAV5]